MRIKYLIAFIIVITILWLIINRQIKNSEAKKVIKSVSTTTNDTTLIASNVAEVKRYYITNTTDTIPSGQSWVKVRNCTEVVGRLDFGGGYADLEEAGSTGDTYYHDFNKQGKVSPKIMLDATGTKFLVEYSK